MNFRNAIKLVLSVVAILVGVISLNREWSRMLQKSFDNDERVLISTAIGDILGDGTPVEVLKVRTPDGLALEVYIPGPQGSRKLLDRIFLEQEKDGYFTLNGQLVSLAIEDIDGDNQLEILAPAFDHQLVAHLNVYRFDLNSRSLQKVTKQL